jgi:MerR family transcriptional regulator, light-induced transcriptional regulator
MKRWGEQNVDGPTSRVGPEVWAMTAGRYKMGTLSRLTGFKPELLRAWQRRFGLFVPERTDGGHRLYTEDDLRVAMLVRDRLAAGRAIGEVARPGREALLDEARRRIPSVDPPEARPGMRSRPALVPVDLSDLAAVREGVVQGAVAIDPEGIRVALDRAFSLGSPDRVIEEVIRPAAHRIGELWRRGACTVAGEHLAASLMRERLIQLLGWASPPPGLPAPQVVCGCLPDEFHENAALVVAYRLARAGDRVAWLGAALPVVDLEAACREIEPSAVYLSVTVPAHFAAARDELIRFASMTRGRFRLVIGGQGVPTSAPDLEAVGAEVRSEI